MATAAPVRLPARRRNIAALMKVFASTRLDALPAIAGIGHAVLLGTMFFTFGAVPWWATAFLAVLYAVGISANINGVAHNFIHNPFFVSPVLNRSYRILLSLTMGFSQTYSETVHWRHHRGNSDHLVAGTTVDWLSIYRHTPDGRPENPLRYTLLGFFRNDPKAIHLELRNRNAREARWGRVELASSVVLIAAMGLLNWKFTLLVFLPAYYAGHSLSNLNGYYEHFGANPDVALAWGVSTYGRLYNVMWFNNGFHAEHHYRPNTHWTKMAQLHERIAEDQRRAGVRVLRHAHPLGFLERPLANGESATVNS
jgi:fatty acid desaturase